MKVESQKGNGTLRILLQKELKTMAGPRVGGPAGNIIASRLAPCHFVGHKVTDRSRQRHRSLVRVPLPECFLLESPPGPGLRLIVSIFRDPLCAAPRLADPGSGFSSTLGRPRSGWPPSVCCYFHLFRCTGIAIAGAKIQCGPVCLDPRRIVGFTIKIFENKGD